VLHGERGAEESDDSIAGQFVHCALVPVDLMNQELEEAVHDAEKRFLAEPLAQLRVAGDVGKEDGHDLALAFETAASSEDSMGEVSRQVPLQLVQLLSKRYSRRGRDRRGRGRARLSYVEAASPAEARLAPHRGSAGGTAPLDAGSALLAEEGILFVLGAANCTDHRTPSEDHRLGRSAGTSGGSYASTSSRLPNT
jgi:hypothetical protein